MEWQLKLRPQKDNSFFTNGITSQLPVPGTIARSTPIHTLKGEFYPYEDNPVVTGRLAGTTNYVENNPLPITGRFLNRGQQRFTINCSPVTAGLVMGMALPKKLERWPS